MQIQQPHLWRFWFSKAGVEPRKLNMLENFPKAFDDQPRLETSGLETYPVLCFY